MRKTLYIIFFGLFVSTFVFGQISKEQKRILSSNMDKIKSALPALEGKLKEELKEYQKYINLYNNIKKQIKKSDSIIDKGLLKTKSLFYSQRASSYRKKREIKGCNC